MTADGGFAIEPTTFVDGNFERNYASVDGGGDYDGDGFADAVSGTLGSVQMILGGAQPTIVSIVTPEFIKPDLLDLEDFDNDGFDDFAIALRSSGSWQGLPAEMVIVYGDADLKELAGKETSIDSDVLNTTVVKGFPTPPEEPTQLFDAYSLDVASPGDLNADGHDDVVVAVVPAGNNLEAQAIVLFGGQARPNESIRVDELDGSDGFVAKGYSQSSHAGVAGGDLNADGIDDLVIGTGGYVHVSYGHQSIGASGVLDLSSQDEAFGFRMSGLSASHVVVADDINGDDIADLLAGSIVLFGGGDWLGSSRYESSMLESGMGFRILAEADATIDNGIGDIGDINSDGLGDFAVGVNRPSEYSDRWYTNRSTAYVVFGHQDIGDGGSLALDNLNGKAGFRYRGVNGVFDYAFAGVGDMNGDGIDDFAMDTTKNRFGPFIGTGPFAGTGMRFDDGAVYFFPGQAPVERHGVGDISELFDMPAESSISVTVNGRLRSAVEELAIESSAKPSVDLSVTLLSELPESIVSGQSVTYEYELFNHTDDVADASRLTDDFATQLENVSWTRVDSTPPIRSLNQLEGIQSIDAETADALYSVQPSFDFDGDGFEDNMSEIVENAIIPKDLFSFRWSSIEQFASLGDVNADGFSDLWIGFDNNGVVVFGSEDFGNRRLEVFKDGRNSIKIAGEFFIPTAAAGIGDINNDGIDDFAIGKTYSFEGRGAAFVVYGSRDWASSEINLFELDGMDGFTLKGERRYLQTHGGLLIEGDDVGERLGAAGDFNGDGIDDFVVGSSPCPVLNQFCDYGDGIEPPRVDHVVFGRDLRSDGLGPPDEEVRVPAHTGIRFTVTGTVPSNIGNLSGEVLSMTSTAQLDRNSANDTARIEIEVQSPITGDINHDRSVDFADFLILSGNFGRKDALAEDGDIDGDQVVGFSDFLILAQHFDG